MNFLSADKLFESVSDVIHRDTQENDNHIDLTAAQVHRITGAGSLDFGGSEFNPATAEKLKPQKQKPDDDYGWWKLGQGPYKLIFNESLKDLGNNVAVISPHPHLREAGVVANTYFISPEEESGSFSINIIVSEAGCNIKENARIAELRMMGD